MIPYNIYLYGVWQSSNFKCLEESYLQEMSAGICLLENCLLKNHDWSYSPIGYVCAIPLYRWKLGLQPTRRPGEVAS